MCRPEENHMGRLTGLTERLTSGYQDGGMKEQTSGCIQLKLTDGQGHEKTIVASRAAIKD